MMIINNSQKYNNSIIYYYITYENTFINTIKSCLYIEKKRNKFFSIRFVYF